MFNIITRYKPIVLRCYTDDYTVYEYFQIRKAITDIPSWWKSLDNKKMGSNGLISNEGRTMKHCPGFVELFKKSLIYPMWFDLNVMAKENGTDNADLIYNSSTNEDYYHLTSHSSDQYGYTFRPGFKHAKLSSPWYLETKEDLDWVVVPAFWNFEYDVSNIFFPPAIDNYKKQHSTTWQFFVKTDETPVFLSANQPLIHMIPMTDRNIVVKSYYDPEKVSKLYQKARTSFFNGSYYKKQNIKKVK